MKEFRLLYLIGDIQDKFILEAAQEQQDTRRGGFSKKFRYCALGLCAAMALCAGLVVYTQFQRTSDSLVDLPKVDRKKRRVGKECRSRWSPYH